MNVPPSPSAELHEYVPLSRHTYMRIGGPARYFASPHNLAALEALIAWAGRSQLPVRIIGGGSNMLVSDGGIEALVLSLRNLYGGIRFEGNHVVAGAAVMLPALARATAEASLGGMEFAVGIPGSVGGALQSNAGIGDGRSIGPLVEAVEVMGGRGFRTLSRDELRFDYRRSNLRGSGVMVVNVTFALAPRPSGEIEAEMRHLLEVRSASQPTAQPNAGSIFRNPPGDFAARLIDAAGCKGLTVGAARISDLHANFIVHDGSATANDVAALMSDVQHRVEVQFGVWLLPEIEWWGDGQPPSPWAGAAIEAFEEE